MDIKPPSPGSMFTDQKCKRACFCNLFPAASLFCLSLFVGIAVLASDYREKFSTWGMTDMMRSSKTNTCANQSRPLGSETLPEGIVINASNLEMTDMMRSSKTNTCANQGRPLGSETLPEGIVVNASNLEMRPLWGSPQSTAGSSANLFAVAAGIKQKDLVNEMVAKFLSCGFVVMLFHYDGIVDDWKDLEWSDRVIHVSAFNQTKWWFAKRFLHPDIVAEYRYIFLWDEDLGVDDFHPDKYISIIESEGLEISQPALDPYKSEVHHQITARRRRSTVHRRMYKPGGPGKGCNFESTAPPCTGFIEMMAPVFSRAAWRCVWYMIQNDLIHAWGLDVQLGYCAQGDRTKNIGIVDAEYIVHYNRPTLGGGNENKSELTLREATSKTEIAAPVVPSRSNSHHNPRVEVRRQSFIELQKFRKRWKKAVEEDKCWTDPYPRSTETNIMS